MNALESIRQRIKPDIEKLNELIAQSLGSPNPMMNTIVEGYLKSKGKMIRPILVILTARMFGSVNDKVMSAAAAVEMLHNASLIHDDVIDETKLRRGYATVNSIWDNHIAVLVGDFFTATALHHALSTDDIRIADVISALGRKLALGEIDQISTARDHLLSEEAYFKIISNKTASLFVSCVRMGAYAVGVDDERLKAMEAYAELLGLCFQIKDDIFDYFSDEKIGKPTGNDLREGKVTLPLLYALSRTDLPQQPEMLRLTHQEELTPEEINTLIDYAKQAGGIDYAYATMAHLRDKATEIIAAIPEGPNSTEAKTDFTALFDFIIHRDH